MSIVKVSNENINWYLKFSHITSYWFVFNSIMTTKDNLIWRLICFNVYRFDKDNLMSDLCIIYIYIYMERNLLIIYWFQQFYYHINVSKRFDSLARDKLHVRLLYIYRKKLKSQYHLILNYKATDFQKQFLLLFKRLTIYCFLLFTKICYLLLYFLG